MMYFTADEHREIVKRLVAIPTKTSGTPYHKAGLEYTSLMICFLMHSKSAAESLLTLHRQTGDEWFPSTTAYVIVRSLFEVDITSHYITRDPVKRSRRYIDFENVIRKNTFEAVERHLASSHSSWREYLQLWYAKELAPKKSEIESAYNGVRSEFENAKGKRAKTWSGKTLRDIAAEVDHLEAYEIFYADLSSFTHVNVMLVNRFLRMKSDGPTWTQRASEYDVGHVFRYAAIFLTCFLELFGKEFGTWDAAHVQACWDIPEAKNRCPA